jgi:SAM-dependent methyltransferase
MTALEAYDDDEAAALYDLVYERYDDDLSLYEEFARRGETPSLELGAGTGRVALRLARAGLDVVALDSSTRMLARLDAALDGAARPHVRVVEADMRDFDLAEKFDLVYCALDTFEHLLTTDDQLAALRCVARHLSPGGVFVAELRSLTAVDWSDEPSALRLEWLRPDPASGGTVAKMSSVAVSRANQTTTSTLIFDRASADGVVRRRTLEVTLRVTGRFEIELLLARAGLRIESLYGSPDLSPFNDASDTMVVVAKLEGA